MSMISAQIDELRRYADMEDGTFPLLASALRDAADTIWELRDDLQRANAAVQDAEHDESMAWDRVRKAEAENAKLRELVKRMFDRISYECRCCSVFCSDWDEDNECCVFTTLMRELKVERWTDEPIRADSCS